MAKPRDVLEIRREIELRLAVLNSVGPYTARWETADEIAGATLESLKRLLIENRKSEERFRNGKAA